MRRWLPTWKWFAASATGVGALTIMLWTGDPAFTDPEKVAIIGFLTERAVAYITPNEEDDG